MTDDQKTLGCFLFTISTGVLIACIIVIFPKVRDEYKLFMNKIDSIDKKLGVEK